MKLVRKHRIRLPIKKSTQTGTTLIELLIVVTIISVLMVIASANFLEIQTRVKTTRVRSDQTVLASALEFSRIDRGNYPSAVPGVSTRELGALTTPISYLSTLPEDPFGAFDLNGRPGEFSGYDFIRCRQSTEPYEILFIEPWYNASVSSDYVLISTGPDLRQHLDYRPPGILNYQFTYTTYDPTNGTISSGDLYGSSIKSANRMGY